MIRTIQIDIIMARRCAFVLLFALLELLCNGVPVPKRPPGFVYRESEVSSTVPVQMESFIDLLCSDSRDAFPVLRQVADMYGPQKLRLSMVMFPLPYHPHAYWASMVAFYVNRNKADSTYDFMQAVFEKYDVVNSDANMNTTNYKAVRMFGEIASDFGVPVESVLGLLEDSPVKDRALDDARVEWKYGCSRGAFGTPNVFLNGVFVTNNQSWTVNDWKAVLDPMIYY
ncbi:uncharacterized protein [Amphiura filiformis]|uniref:uncharacterized protein n=1 Tax=Amphiura filiformis TaxID=82378 RepID=UPI003B21366E